MPRVRPELDVLEKQANERATEAEALLRLNVRGFACYNGRS